MRGIKLIDITSGAERHTADDWDLIMSSKIIGMPKSRISKVDMSDRDGDLDMSESMLGRVSYKNRVLSFSFTCTAHQSTWAELRDEIAGFVHGKRLKIIDPDTPEHYYIGRCELDEPSYKGGAIMFLTITVDADPYRLRLVETVGMENVTAGSKISLINSTMPVIPTITVTADMTIAFGTFSVSLASGSVYQIPQITLMPGENIITVTGGSGKITVTYRQGTI